MPTYEYQCPDCGEKFEKFQSITAAPVKKCPKCGKHKVKRLIGTGAGLIFKGSGFYITDYRDESYKTAAKGDNGTAPGSSDAAKPSGETAGKSADSSSGPPAEAMPKAESKPKSESNPKSESRPKTESRAEPRAAKSSKK